MLLFQTSGNIYNEGAVTKFRNNAYRGVKDLVAGKTPTYSSDTLMGIEIEIEHCRKAMLDTASNDAIDLMTRTVTPFFITEQDRSLRNNGVEFISRVGLNVSEILIGLENLNAWLKKYEPGEFNYRTGLHVHVGFNTTEVQHINNFVMLYILFEDSLFKVSGNRKENKYCVPIREAETNVHNLLYAPEEYYASYAAAGMKYLAMNYLPLARYGTIEFRHHHGTSDLQEITQWIKLIDYMRNYALSMTFNELKEKIFELNTHSSYTEFARDVFKDMFPTVQENIDRDMREGSAFLKELYVKFTMTNPKPSGLKKKPVILDNPQPLFVEEARNVLDEARVQALRVAVNRIQDHMQLNPRPMRPILRDEVEF